MLKLILYIYLAIAASCFICMSAFFLSVSRSLKKTHGKKNSYCLASIYIPISFVTSLIPIIQLSMLKELIFNYGQIFEAACEKFEKAEAEEES